MTTTWQDAESAGLLTVTERQRSILDEVEPASAALKVAREFSAGNAVNQTYLDAQSWDYMGAMDAALDGESDPDAERRILTKAAQALRNGVPATFTGPELDLVRHLMPAHAVHQSGAVRWLLETYGPVEVAI
jgi:hypothetical protein